MDRYVSAVHTALVCGQEITPLLNLNMGVVGNEQKLHGASFKTNTTLKQNIRLQIPGVPLLERLSFWTSH
jgi:hypothetical protein